MSSPYVEKSPHHLILGIPSFLAIKFFAQSKKVYCTQAACVNESTTTTTSLTRTVSDAIDTVSETIGGPISTTWSFANRIDLLGLEIGYRLKIGRPKLVTFMIEVEPVAVTPAAIFVAITGGVGIWLGRAYLPNNIFSTFLYNLLSIGGANVQP